MAINKDEEIERLQRRNQQLHELLTLVFQITEDLRQQLHEANQRTLPPASVKQVVVGLGVTDD